MRAISNQLQKASQRAFKDPILKIAGFNNIQRFVHDFTINGQTHCFTRAKATDLLKKQRTEAEQLLKDNNNGHMGSFKKLKSLCDTQIPEKKMLQYLHFMIKRTESYSDDEIGCFYNLDGVGNFDKDTINSIIKMFDNIEMGQGNKEQMMIILNYNQLCANVYQKYLGIGTKSYKQTVISLLNEEIEKQLLTYEMLHTKFTKSIDEFSNDMFVNQLVSECDPESVSNYFPMHRYDLLHCDSDAHILQTVSRAVQELGSWHLLGSYKRTKNIDLLASVLKYLSENSIISPGTPGSLSSHLIDGALRELSDVYTNQWNDYVLIVLAKKGIFPKGFNFSEGLRLGQEDVCIHFLNSETRLFNETSYRNEVLSKCTNYGWIRLSKLINEKTQSS